MNDIECASCTVPTLGLVKTITSIAPLGRGDKPGTLQEVVAEVHAAGWDSRDFVRRLNLAARCMKPGESVSLDEAPDWRFEIQQTEVPLEAPKVFDGDAEQAELAGWQQNEFGWVCADCSGIAHTTEDGTACVQKGLPEGLLDYLLRKPA